MAHNLICPIRMARNKSIRFYLLGAGVFFFSGICILCGAYLYRYNSPIFDTIKYVTRELADAIGVPDSGFSLDIDLQDIECQQIFSLDGLTVILVAGQSNGANSAALVRNKTQTNLYQFDFRSAKCFHAREPLLGNTGSGSSIVYKLSVLYAGKKKRPVLIVPLAVADSSIEEWSRDDGLRFRLIKALTGLGTTAIGNRFLLWIHGEKDRNRDAAYYEQHFLEILNALYSLDSDLKVYFGLSTYCNGGKNEQMPALIQSLAARYENLYVGANTDDLTDRFFRDDDCHLNNIAQSIAAERWMKAIVND
jgi:hypothetical protein